MEQAQHQLEQVVLELVVVLGPDLDLDFDLQDSVHLG